MAKDYYCGECGKPTDAVERDFGIGSYEYWGATGVDSNVHTVSKCCDGDLFSDPELENEVVFSDD